MNYLLNTLTDGGFSPLADFFFDNDERSYSSSNIMKTDIKEREHDYVLEVELPGFEKNNIKLDYENGYLNIAAKINKAEGDKNTKYLRKERFVGTFRRSYYVGEINKESISASYKDGILEIVLPKEDKKEIEQRRAILIK